MEKVKICVIGLGPWGQNYIRTLLRLGVEVGCVDSNSMKLNKIKSDFSNVRCFSTINQSLKYDFDGFIIATPSSTHSKLAKIVISNNKPVLIEKPLALSLSEAKELLSFTKKYDGKVLVGHLMLFHPAIQKIKSMIKEGIIGDLKYIYSNRLSLGTIRSEENVLWSFAPHDISIFQYIINSFPAEIFANGVDILQSNFHDSAILYLKYPRNIKGHIFVNWLHPFKEHKIVIIGSKGSISFEDSKKGKPLMLYENDLLKISNESIKRNASPKKIIYDQTMPLDNLVIHFIDIIINHATSKVDIHQGIEVTEIMDLATRSFNQIASP